MTTETKTKFSIGPWEVIGDGFDSCSATDCETDGYQVIYRDKGGFPCGVCEIDYRSDDAEAEANAHLIAAAPELLEALQELYSNVADTDSGVIDLESNFMVKARAAIAKTHRETESAV